MRVGASFHPSQGDGKCPWNLSWDALHCEFLCRYLITLKSCIRHPSIKYRGILWCGDIRIIAGDTWPRIANYTKGWNILEDLPDKLIIKV